jgi:tRNA threonylcarbamoyl adenosine modification protein YjeE
MLKQLERVFVGSEGESSKVVVECPLADVEQLAVAVAPFLNPGDWIFLEGDLGTGKTTLTQRLVDALGGADALSSPTFPVVHSVRLRDPRTRIQKVCHMDFYRLKSAAELSFLGIELEFSSDSICIIEWAELIDAAGWAEFFQRTHCRKPKRLFKMAIATLALHANQRSYSLEQQDIFEVLGITKNSV